MATPEGKIKAGVSAALKKHDVYYEMPVPSGYGKSGLDYNGCHHGKYFSIETKAPGKKPTPRQELTIAAIEKSGGKVFVIDGPIGIGELEWWLGNN